MEETDLVTCAGFNPDHPAGLKAGRLVCDKMQHSLFWHQRAGAARASDAARPTPPSPSLCAWGTQGCTSSLPHPSQAHPDFSFRRHLHLHLHLPLPSQNSLPAEDSTVGCATTFFNTITSFRID